MQRGSFSVFFRFLEAFLHPFRWIFAACGFFLLLYVLVLKLNGPTALVQYVLQKSLPQSTLTLKPITGVFPFSFQTDLLEIRNPTQAFSFQNIKVSLNWHTFMFHVKPEKVRISLPPQPSEPRVTNVLFQDYSEIYVRMVRQTQSLAFLKFFDTILLPEINLSGLPGPLSLTLAPHETEKDFFVGSLVCQEKTYLLRIGQDSKAKAKNAYKIFFEQKKGSTSSFTLQGGASGTQQQLKIKADLDFEQEGVRKRSTLQVSFKPEAIPAFLKALAQDKPQNKTQDKKTPLQDAAEPSPTPPPFTKIMEGQIFFPTEKKCFCGQFSLFDSCTFCVDFSQKDRGPNIPENSAFEKKQTNEKETFEKLGVLYVQHVSPKKVEFSATYNPQKTFPSSGPASGDHILCQGFVQKNILALEKIQGVLKKRPLLIQPLQWKGAERRLSPVLVSWGPYTLKTTDFSFHKGASFPNAWTLGRIQLFSENKSLYFGAFDLQGKTLFGENGTQTSFKFSLIPQDGEAKKNGASKCQTLKISTKGEGVLSAAGLSFSTLQILTDKNKILKASFAISPQTPSLSDLFAGIFKTSPPKVPLDQREAAHKVSVQGAMQGDLTLTPITIFLSTGDVISGDVSMNLHFSGDLKNPDVAGTFQLVRGLYENASNGIFLKNISIHAVGQKNALKMKEIRLTDGTSLSKKTREANTFPIDAPPQGYAGGSGFFRFFSPQGALVPELDFSLHCNHLQVAYSSLTKARASGIVSMKGPVSGRSTQTMVTGDIVLDHLVVDIAEKTEAPLEEPPEEILIFENGKKISFSGEEILAVPQKTSSTTKRFSRFSMNVLLRTGGITRVKDKGLACALKGQIWARGCIDDAYLVGSLELDKSKRNFYNLFGKIMTAKNGVILYDETALNDPYLDVTLNASISGKDVFATLLGRVSNLEIRLRSHPPLANEEILSLILFQQGLQGLSANQNLQVRAVSSQMLQGSFGFFEKLRRALLFDSFEVVETQNLANGETTQSVRIGKQFKRAKVFLNQDLSSQNKSKMTVRFDLTPELGVEADVGTEKSSSKVGIQWLKRY
ncbi:hypothetical protein AGMMS49949_06370 [Alphaproteobacteria bacterium]|nr:hypothetical protein AGMMS49949_06370 [Alphaproteobacteria bacterium]GHS98302.1 hypothetical protein AGMMS50296_5880 [Alphaproteobacteria bacterium]